MSTTVTSTTNSPEEVAAALETPAKAPVAAPPVPPVAGEAAPAAETPPVASEVPAEEPAAAAAPPVVPDPNAPPAEEDDEADVTVKPKAGDRVGRLKYDRYILKQQNARLQKLVEDALVAKTPDKTQPPVPPPGPAKPTFSEAKPDLKDFETIEEWTEKLSDWTGRKVSFDVEQNTLAAQARIEQEQRTRAEQDVISRHNTRVEAYRQAHPEFDASLTRGQADPPPMTPLIAAHLFHSEQGPALMQYLEEHRAEAAQIAGMPYGPALVALGKLEARLESPPVSPTAPAAPVVRRPPVPPTPIKPLGAGSSTTVGKSPDDMDQAEFKAWRKSQGASH